MTTIVRMVAAVSGLVLLAAALPAQTSAGVRGTPSPTPAVVENDDSTPTLPAIPEGFDQWRPLIPRGRVEVFQYPSKRMGILRDIVVYTPPGYSTDQRYPVLYLLHGLTDIETEWAFNRGRLREIMDGLIADGNARPMIVVMPSGEATADGTKRHTGPVANEAYANFEGELLEEIIPYIDRHYATLADREHRALFGWSMGGGQALNFGLAHLDTFAYVGGFSAAPNTRPVEQLIPDPDAARRQLKLLWLSCGDRDTLMTRVNRPLHEALQRMGIPHYWRVDAGAHEWHVPRRHLYLVAQLLFKD